MGVGVESLGVRVGVESLGVRVGVGVESPVGDESGSGC